uniref:Uncharacterized protein n=1 Tax=Gopherus agassizii TaxID=38772 RepID=A0A452GUY7_9SAUR
WLPRPRRWETWAWSCWDQVSGGGVRLGGGCPSLPLTVSPHSCWCPPAPVPVDRGGCECPSWLGQPAAWPDPLSGPQWAQHPPGPPAGAGTCGDAPREGGCPAAACSPPSHLLQVGKELQLRRAAWLRWEALHRLLQEALIEQRAGRGDASPALEHRKFLETLEQRLLLGELSRILEPGPSLRGDRPPLLGLGAPDLRELLPPSQVTQPPWTRSGRDPGVRALSPLSVWPPPVQDLALLQQHLPQEIEERLRRKGLALLSYHRPDSGEWVGAGEQGGGSGEGVSSDPCAPD